MSSVQTQMTESQQTAESFNKERRLGNWVILMGLIAVICVVLALAFMR